MTCGWVSPEPPAGVVQVSVPSAAMSLTKSPLVHGDGLADRADAVGTDESVDSSISVPPMQFVQERSDALLALVADPADVAEGTVPKVDSSISVPDRQFVQVTSTALALACPAVAQSHVIVAVSVTARSADSPPSAVFTR